MSDERRVAVALNAVLAAHQSDVGTPPVGTHSLLTLTGRLAFLASEIRACAGQIESGGDLYELAAMAALCGEAAAILGELSLRTVNGECHG